MEMIRYNRPHIAGKEIENIKKAFEDGRLSGNGQFTKECQAFFRNHFNFEYNYLTTSASDALEMAAILANIKQGDEVIMPSYTFSSTANAFILRGAEIVFADSYIDQPNIDHNSIESLITSRTKAIVVVHYAGVACEMDSILKLAKKYDLLVVEDAAQAIDSYYKGKPLGSIGDFGVYSFHETKNISCGEGGLLMVRDEDRALRAEIILEKGTNRSAFFRGDIDKYGWVDVGSSFLMSEILAAALAAQLEELKNIQKRRNEIWFAYYDAFTKIDLNGVKLPVIPKEATVNGHLFYLVCKDLKQRGELIAFLKQKGIKAVFHYQPLHQAKYYKEHSDKRPILPNADRFGDCLVRLPLFVDLTNAEQQYIIDQIKIFFDGR